MDCCRRVDCFLSDCYCSWCGYRQLARQVGKKSIRRTRLACYFTAFWCWWWWLTLCTAVSTLCSKQASWETSGGFHHGISSNHRVCCGNAWYPGILEVLMRGQVLVRSCQLLWASLCLPCLFHNRLWVLPAFPLLCSPSLSWSSSISS